MTSARGTEQCPSCQRHAQRVAGSGWAPHIDWMGRACTGPKKVPSAIVMPAATPPVSRKSQRALPPKVFEVWVQRRYGSCQRKACVGTPANSVRVEVPTVRDSSRYVELCVTECLGCQRFICSLETIRHVEETVGVLLIQRVAEPCAPSGLEREYAANTVLSRHGYFVSQDHDPGTVQRRAILRMLVESQIASKSDILALLSTFITERRARCPRAAEIWEADRTYIDGHSPSHEPLFSPGKLLYTVTKRTSL